RTYPKLRPGARNHHWPSQHQETRGACTMQWVAYGSGRPHMIPCRDDSFVVDRGGALTTKRNVRPPSVWPRVNQITYAQGCAFSRNPSEATSEIRHHSGRRHVSGARLWHADTE